MIRRDVLKGFIGLCTTPATIWAQTRTSSAQAQNGTLPDPWSADQTVSPAALSKELADSNASDKATVICIGFRNFYQSAHITGASFHGPTSTPDGLADLKQYAQGLPRTANIVIYCGCCPLVHCPNVRPAFTELRGMAFTHLRLLQLPQSFATDWLKAGYPVDGSL